MLYMFILLLYGATSLQDVLVGETSFTPTTTLQKQILEILAPNIYINTSEEICLRISADLIAYGACFYKTFPTATNITHFLTEACLNLNFAMLGTFGKTLNGFSNLDDYILVSCLYSLPGRISFKDYPDFLRLLLSLPRFNYSTKRLQRFLFQLLSLARKSNSTFTLIHFDLIFKAWRPFSNNVIGMVGYKNATYLDLESELSPAKMDDKDFDIAFYLPFDFLNKLVENFTLQEKMELRVIILVIKDEEMSQSLFFDHSKALGIDFGGICLNNEFKMIRILYRTNDLSVTQREYSQNDFDPVGCAALTCHFPRMLFANLGNQDDDSKFCRRLTLARNSTNMTWLPAANFGKVFPARFCMSEECKMYYTYCHFGKHLYEHGECYEGDYNSHTQKLYEHYRCCCYDPDHCRTRFDIDAINNYIDVKISILHLHRMMLTFEDQIVHEPSGDIMDKGLELLGHEDMGLNHLLCMVRDLLELNDIAIFAGVFQIKKKNYIYFRHTLNIETAAIGFVLHRNSSNDDFNDYHIKRITDKNISYDYLTDDAVEVVIYLPIESRNKSERDVYIDQRVFVVRNANLMKNGTFSCRSRIVLVQQYNFMESRPEFLVYLKTVQDASGSLNMFRKEGYWFTITPSNHYSIVFCLAELSENPCNSVKQVMIYTFESYSVKVDSSPEIRIQNQTIIPLDMLSQLSILMNPAMKQMFQDYFYLFHIVALAESWLSALGLLCIFASALIHTGWCEKKYNTVQLSISLTLEIAFFLIDVDKITHIGYLIFFYSILAQFAWMLIIGYAQYLKFVKVFTSPSMNRKKSLILGWFSPAIIMLFPVLLHSDCLKCDLCYKNDQIFNYFVIGPASLIILTNLIIYFIVMYNILRIQGGETSDELRKAKLRAAILFPFLLGISWISIFALISPWSWMSIGGSFMFHIVTPSQGFVLFVFAVILDKETRIEWRRKFSDFLSKMSCEKRKRNTDGIELKIA